MNSGIVGAWLARYRVESVAVAVSLLLSLWLICLDGVINNDGVLYLKSAEAFAAGHWKEAIEIYRWPLYAALIAVVHQVGGLEVDAAAYVLNSVLYVVLVWAFLAIVKVFGANRRTLWFAMIFILALPSLNNYRTFVIRDVGYWAFYLLGLLAFFKFQLRPRLRLALAWGAAMTMATLFRIEGIVFLICLPVALLWRPETTLRETTARFAQLNVVLLFDALAAIAWFALQGPRAFSGRLFEPLMRIEMFGEQLSSGLAEKADVLGKSVLNQYSDDFAVSGVLVILLLILITYVAKGLGLLGAFAAAYAWGTRAVPITPEVRRALVIALALNVTVLIVFTVSQFFLTGRFAISVALTLALLAPFGMNRVYERWRDRDTQKHRKRNWMFPVMVFLLLIMAVDTLWSFGSSKMYLKEAGLWLRAETPREIRLYSDSIIVGFYAHKTGDEWKPRERTSAELRKAGALRQYDYAAIVLTRDESVPSPFGSARAIREFRNDRNDRVLIFRVSDLKADS